MSRALDRIRAKPWVAYVEDEREAKNGITIGLRAPYDFIDSQAQVNRFRSIKEATNGTRSNAVHKVIPEELAPAFSDDRLNKVGPV